jgi:hypothetical protein
VIAGAVHSPAIENPPRTLEVLLDFWADPRPAGTGQAADAAGVLR